MNGHLALESHPISIANASSEIMPGRGLDLHIKGVGDWSTRLRDIAQKTPIEMARDPEGDTARIVKVILQGPYGGLGYADAAKSEAVLFVAGGSGITFALALLEDLIGSSRAGGRRRRTRTRIIALVWTASDPDLVKTFAGQLQALLDLARGILIFSVRIHITSPPTSDPDKLRLAIPGANLFAGRPNLDVLVNGVVDALLGPRSSGSSKGGIMTIISGPPELVKAARTAVRRVDRAKSVAAGGIVVHSEAFGW